MTYLLAIDQGTTNSRAILFNQAGIPLYQYNMALPQYFPHPGWVEQNPQDILQNTITCCQQVLKAAQLSAKEISAIGIANQRETTIIWDKKTGLPIYPAIVWQDRRTAAICQKLATHPIAESLQKRTGLLLDPYFSASKIIWILDHIKNAREDAEKGRLLFGTVDSYLIWQLTQGVSHLTDATNASRTLLFNLATQTWDQEILQAFQIPASLLPTVIDNAAYFGDMHETLLGRRIPILGLAGDQQAAAIGQACIEPGTLKATFGTGAFLLLNTGSTPVISNNKLLTTVAFRLNKKISYGLEGSIFCTGATIKWLRDTLHLIRQAAESETLANSIKDTEGVYLVPAFTGLGAPYWDATARAAIVGLTRNSSPAHIVRAALESVAYQTRDLIEAMRDDLSLSLHHLCVDGGMAANHWLLQFLADILGLQIQKPKHIETSAFGAAYLAGLKAGIYPSLEEVIKLATFEKIYQPIMPKEHSKTFYQGWQRAVKQVLT